MNDVNVGECLLRCSREGVGRREQGGESGGGAVHEDKTGFGTVRMLNCGVKMGARDLGVPVQRRSRG